MLDGMVTGKDYKECEEMFKSKGVADLASSFWGKGRYTFGIVSLYVLTKLIFCKTVHLDKFGLFLIS